MVFTDLLDATASKEYLEAAALLRRFHLPLTLAVADVPLQKLAAEQPRDAAHLYNVLTARDLLAGRSEMLHGLERQGALVLDTAPERLTIDAVNRYLAPQDGNANVTHPFATFLLRPALRFASSRRPELFVKPQWRLLAGCPDAATCPPIMARLLVTWNVFPAWLTYLGLVGCFFFRPTLTTWILFAVMIARYLSVTVGYHRYFSHHAFRTSRGMQFLLAVVGCTCGQRGLLWWTAIHRQHHHHTDTALDPHSPQTKGFWTSFFGWTMQTQWLYPDWRLVRDRTRYPELVWINKWWGIPWRFVCWVVISLAGGLASSGVIASVRRSFLRPPFPSIRSATWLARSALRRGTRAAIIS